MRAFTWAAGFALAALLWLGVAPCKAQEEAKEAAQEAKWEGSLLVGVQVLEGDRASSKFEEYRTVPSGPWVDLLTVERNEENTGKYLLFEAIHPGLDDGRAALRLGQYGAYGLELYWDKIPHLLSNTGRTIFQQSGSTFTLPVAVRQDLQQIAATDIDPSTSGTQIDTAAFGAIINGLAQPTQLRVDRETLAISYNQTVNERSSYSASVSNERRTGNMPIGTSFSFTNQVELPLPVDYRTRDINADYEYRGKRGVLRLGYWGSFFHNENRALIWDNPISAADASGSPSRGRLALPPSNTANTLSLTGAVDLGRGTRLTGVLSAGQMRQNEDFLPNTINTALVSPTLPATSADASIRTQLTDFTLTSRPADGVSLTARFRQRTVRNRTPERIFEGTVTADTSVSTEETENEPISFDVRNTSLDAGWDINRGLALRVGAERETWHRTHRDVQKTDEDTLRASLDYRASESVLARLILKRSQRDIDGAYVGIEEQLPQLRKFDEASRDRDSIGFLVDYNPSERWSATISGNMAKDDYEDSLFGLRDDRAGDISVDFAYAVNEASSLLGGVSLERYRYLMNSRYRPLVSGSVVDDPLNDWNSTSTDTDQTYWLGYNRTVIPGKLDWDASLSLTRGKGQINAVGVPGGDPRSEPIPFPDVRYTLGIFSAGVKYRVANDRTVRLGYRFEKYDESDFATDIMQPYMGTVDSGTATSVFLGARQPDYRAHFITLSLQQRF